MREIREQRETGTVGTGARGRVDGNGHSGKRRGRQARERNAMEAARKAGVEAAAGVVAAHTICLDGRFYN